MDALPPPLAFFLLLFSGWVHRQQQAVIAYLREENRVLRAERGSGADFSPTTGFRRRTAYRSLRQSQQLQKRSRRALARHK